MGKLLFFSSLGARGAPVLASAIAHVAIVAVATVGGHGRGTSGALAGAPEISVEIENLKPEQAPVPSEPAGPGALDHDTVHDFPHHTHPYAVPLDHDAHPHDPSIDHRLTVPMSHDGAAAARLDEAEPVAAGAVEAAAAAPHFSMVFGGGAAYAGGATRTMGVSAPGAATSDGHGSAGVGGGEAAVPEALVSAPARLLSSVRPGYPAAARSAEIEADVGLEIVVDAGGAVVDAHVLRTAGAGFDASALEAVRRYRFTPALRGGAPVRVRMRWTMQFRLD